MKVGPNFGLELAATLLGSKIGFGVARKVYACRTNPLLVVKIERNGQSFQNACEWTTWQQVRDTKYARWFAPCHYISPCGIILLMGRTTPAGPRGYPKQMPRFVSDFKRANYGVIDGKFVCHDYGLFVATVNGLNDNMRNVKWWDHP